MKIFWCYEGEPGFWESSDERFAITPIYCGQTRPVAYELHDTKTGHVSRGHCTVSEAKAKAHWMQSLPIEDLM